MTTIADVFSSHMILQRNRPIAIWGTELISKTVTVTLGKKSCTAPVSGDGRWQAELPAIASGGPFTLSVHGSGEIVLDDILIGDIWLAAGQSQMRSELFKVSHAGREIALADHPQIRLFQIPFTQSTRPVETLEGTWQVCTPETAAGFSAMAYYFGRRIQMETGVPVGLINSAIGGSKIEAFFSLEGLRAFPNHDYRPLLQNLESRTLEEVDADYCSRQQKWQESIETLKQTALQTDAGMQDGQTLWTEPDFDDSGWGTVHLPGVFGEQKLPRAGAFWLRRSFELPSEGTQLSELHLGFISDRDTVWINGRKIEGLDRYNAGRIYRVEGGWLRPGQNSIVLRIISPVAAAVYASREELRLVNDRLSVPLGGQWKGRNGSVVDPGQPPSYIGVRSYMPCLLYNAMVHPFTRVAIKGVIWSQGEANTTESGRYEALMRALIADWRRIWKNPDLPFIWEQTTSDGHPDDDYAHESMRAEIRDAQRRVLNMPKTGMAQLIDVTGIIDLHYLDKETAGNRMARAALHCAYETDCLPGGPLYRSHRVEGNRIVLNFDCAGDGLATRDGQSLNGFTIAGADRIFYRAEAEINDAQVNVHSQNVQKPVAVRYAWSSNPARANLINSDKLPAGTFRTDDWPCLGLQ